MGISQSQKAGRIWPGIGIFLPAIVLLLLASPVFAQTLDCDLTQYRGSQGLSASVERDLLVVTWMGQNGVELRVRYGIEGKQPVIRDLAIRRRPGQWAVLGENLIPEYHVVSGVRRMTTQQARPLERELGMSITQDVIDKHRWYAFWDAPLVIPGTPVRNQTPRVYGLPRTPEEVRRAEAVFDTSACSVRTDGARLEVTFPGLSMGIFSGNLRFTVYRGTNLIRMEAVARTEEPWVAYKYDAGLRGFSTGRMARLTWRDTGGHPQQYRFGGIKNDVLVPLKAQSRVLVAEGDGGSLATFPPPHKFFWTREVHTNLGYVWYRKDGDARFGMGVRQAEGEEVEEYKDNFALYNAPPGTWQRMAVYFYPSADKAGQTRQSVLAFTHGDTFKPVPGYKVFSNHWHLRFTERIRATGSLDTPLPDLAAMKALGLNILGLSDFHGDMHAGDSGALRFKDQKDYREAARRASDQDFLVLPWEEPNTYFGGHWNILFPKNVYYSKVRKEGQPFSEMNPDYGKVYHVGSAADAQRLLDEENGYWYTGHPRTKGSAGYPDGYWEKEFAKNDRFLGIDFNTGMGMDLSEQRMCEWRCFDAIDTMNNLYSGSGLRPKYLIPDIDTYRQGPEDDQYPRYQVAYLKLDRVPGPDDDWTPILRALRDGNFFVTTGEILITNYAVRGSGTRRTVTADLEWTFPLEFVEVVWGDGRKVGRQVISAAELPPLGSKHFAVPFDAAGKTWVRFAVWDSAGNGAFVNPVWLNTQAAADGGR